MNNANVLVTMRERVPAKAGAFPARVSPQAFYAQAPTGELSMKTMLAVTTLHVAALFLLLHPLWQATPQEKVLSFTVTMMDLSASQNTISSAASSASAPAVKSESKTSVQETKVDTPNARVKKVVKTVAATSPKTNAPLSHHSQAQTSVLAPLTPAQFDAAYLQNPKPTYPALSRRLGEQGTIVLSVYVNEAGAAEKVELKQSSGFDRLDDAALDAVSRWRFAAAKQGDRLVASWVQVPVKFVLE